MLTDKQIYDLNNMNVAAQNVSLGNMLDEMAFSDSPEFTGTPTAPTAEAGTDDDQIATTAFVQNAVSGGGGGGFRIITDNSSDPTATAELIIDCLNNDKLPVVDVGGNLGYPWIILGAPDYEYEATFKFIVPILEGSIGSFKITAYIFGLYNGDNGWEYQNDGYFWDVDQVM